MAATHTLATAMGGATKVPIYHYDGTFGVIAFVSATPLTEFIARHLKKS
jgi:hypothetical protein